MFIQFVQLSGIKFCKLGDKNPQISEEEKREVVILLLISFPCIMWENMDFSEII